MRISIVCILVVYFSAYMLFAGNTCGKKAPPTPLIQVHPVTASPGNTLLHFAVVAGERVLVARLLSENVFPVDIRNGLGNTPLHLAAARSDSEFVSLLLGFHADVASITSARCTALHIAAAHDNSVAVNALLTAGADPLAIDILGRKPCNLTSNIKILSLLSRARVSHVQQ